MESPRLSFLITTHNRRDALAKCLDSIAMQTYDNIECVIVIDGSTDGTAQMLAESYPEAVVLDNGERKGLGFSKQRGVAAATGEVLINLDDDCYFLDDTAAETIARYFRDGDWSALCFRVQAPDGSVRHREIPLRSKKLPAEDTRIGYYLGGAVAFRRSELERIGGYATEVKYGSDETDTSFRLFKAGGTVLFVPSIRVVHMAIPSPFNTAQRQANYVRSEVRMAAKFLPFPYAQVHALLWTADCLRQAVSAKTVGPTLTAARETWAKWFTFRADKTWRLTVSEARALSALSGRTWY